jgi:serine/threonine protein kinase
LSFLFDKGVMTMFASMRPCFIFVQLTLLSILAGCRKKQEAQNLSIQNSNPVELCSSFLTPEGKACQAKLLGISESEIEACKEQNCRFSLLIKEGQITDTEVRSGLSDFESLRRSTFNPNEHVTLVQDFFDWLPWRQQPSPKQYSLGALLGKGGTSEVRYAQDTNGSEYAAKFLVSAQNLEQQIIQAHTQARELCKPTCPPHILKIFEIGKFRNSQSSQIRSGIVTELASKDLSKLGEHLDLSKPVANASERALALLEIVRQLSLALKTLTLNKLLHNDLKPENIFMRGDEILIADFDGLTSPGQIAPIGNFEYSCFEVLTQKPVPANCDVSSLGSIVLRWITSQKQGNLWAKYKGEIDSIQTAESNTQKAMKLALSEVEKIQLQLLENNDRTQFQNAFELLSQQVIGMLHDIDTKRILPSGSLTPEIQMIATQAFKKILTEYGNR